MNVTRSISIITILQSPSVKGLTRVNWRGLVGAAGASYAAALPFLLTYFPTVPVYLSKGIAGLAAFGAAIGFFVQTYHPVTDDAASGTQQQQQSTMTTLTEATTDAPATPATPAADPAAIPTDLSPTPTDSPT